MTDPIPAHGFVLAGGKSSRMGRDKATLPFLGRPMVEIAVEKLRSILPDVSVAGNQGGLDTWAAVVRESRFETGPIAGMEAGLLASTQDWSLFVPVDVPLAPASLLATWARATVAAQESGTRLSYLRVQGVRQPAFCLMRRDCLPTVIAAVDQGERKLGVIFERVAEALGTTAVRAQDVEELPLHLEGGNLFSELFSNVNTPGDLVALELWAKSHGYADVSCEEEVMHAR